MFMSITKFKRQQPAQFQIAQEAIKLKKRAKASPS